MIFDLHVLTVDEPRLVQALMKSRDQVSKFARRSAVEKAYHRHRRLLRARCERHGGRAAEERDELAAIDARDHSITSSASARTEGGNSKVMAFAASRLITSSNLVG